MARRPCVRAFGVFHQVSLGGNDSWNTVTNPPAQYTPTIFYDTMDRLPSLASTGILRPTPVTGWQRDSKTPVVYNMTVGVQRDIGFGTVVDVAYAGTRSRYLERTKNLNLVPYGARFLPENRDPTTGGALAGDFYRPYLGYNGISLIQNVGYGNYDSLQVAINRRFTRGLQFGLAYTFSKTLDVGNVPTYQSLRDWTYGPAGDSQPHVLVINYTWDLPRASRLWNTPAVRAVLDGWQLAGVTAFASGYPFTPGFGTTDGADIWGGGDDGWAIRTADPNLPHGDRTFDRWFDTSVFQRPTAATFGTPSRNIIQGPGYQNWDLSLFKRIPLGGSRSLQFRLEAYNAFNHTQCNFRQPRELRIRAHVVHARCAGDNAGAIAGGVGRERIEERVVVRGSDARGRYDAVNRRDERVIEHPADLGERLPLDRPCRPRTAFASALRRNAAGSFQRGRGGRPRVRQDMTAPPAMSRIRPVTQDEASEAR